MDMFTRFIVLPWVSLGIFSTACFVGIIFFEDIEKVIRKYKRNPSFRAAVYVRLGLYGMLALLALVVHFI